MQNEVARTVIVIEGDADKLKATLKEAGHKVKDFGDEADKQGKRAGKALDDVKGKAGKLGSSLGKIQESLGKLLIPIAFVTGVTALIKKMDELRNEAEGFRKELDAISNISLDKLQGVLAGQNFDELGQSILELEKQRRAEIDKTTEAFETKASSAVNFLRSGFQDITGIDLGFDREDAAKAVEEAQERINRNYESLINNLKEQFKIQEEEAAKLEAKEKEKAEAIEAEKTAALENRLRIEARAADERNTAQIAAAEQAAQAFADKFDQVFGADFTTRLDKIAAALTRGNNAIGRLK
jgi:hypothetical protein